ncbi:MAG: DUF499 domain-containing protein [Roseibacillus sp.]
MKTLKCCQPRQSVLDGSEDFVVNLSALQELSEAEAKEFLDANVLTSGMEELISQSFDRLAGGPSRGIFKLSESMGGGKTQSMIVCGLLARFPALAASLHFAKAPKNVNPDHVIAFTGRDTDKNIWITLGEVFDADFVEDSAPSEKQWAALLKGKSVLFLLDELAFYLVHASTKGDKEEGARFSKRTSIALTNLFGAVRDHKEASQSAVVVADLQKDWDQGHEELAKIMRSDATLGGTIQSADNEMSKGAVSISPVDNTKDELYSILRKRLFKDIAVSDAEKKEVIDAYFNELQTAKKAGLIERALPTIREELEVSYPFHFSTKHLIETFNDNPGFQKTRDVIRLMASIVRSIWEQGDAAVSQHLLLSLASPDLNVSAVASRFKEIKRSLEGALQTDLANGGTSYAESLMSETDGLSLPAAKWIYAASLSDTRPHGLSKEELAEYMAAPGVDISGLGSALEELSRTSWYLDQFRSGRFFFNKVKNLNAQINSHYKLCSDADRDDLIEDKLREMFDPRDKRCYQNLEIHPDLSKVRLSRDKTTLLICQHDADYQAFFQNEKFKNRVAILTLLDPAGLLRIRNHAKRFWAIREVLKDMTKDDQQFEKAKGEQTNIQTELFMALRSLYARLFYPLGDPTTGDTKLTDTTLLDSFQDDLTGQNIKFEGDKNSSKGELVVESTLRSVAKFHVIPTATGGDKLKGYKSLRTRFEQFLFPSSGRASWDQLIDGAASRGIMVWTEPGTSERMKDALLTAGEWRQEAGQILKPPFVELATVHIDYDRNAKTGSITTTDIKLIHGDSLFVSEDGGPEKKIKHDEAFVSDAMTLVFQCRDSTGKNQDGTPYTIQNQVTLKHEFLDCSTPGHRTLKLGVVPTDSIVKWTADGSDAANNGQPYSAQGIDVPEGATVKVFAEKNATHNELSIPVPKDDAGDDDDQPTTGLDLDLPANLSSQAMRKMELSTRLAVHGLLSKLPPGTTISGARAKVVKAATDNRVAVSWDGKTEVSPERIFKAYEFLDAELQDAEWELEATGKIVFPSGREFLDWQKETSYKIAPGFITQ